MSEEREGAEVESTPDTATDGETAESVEATNEREPMPPVESRFMYVDIAALRAKQLRRGAVPRVTMPGVEGDAEGSSAAKKLERIAMREVEEGLIVYEIPNPKEANAGGSKAEEHP